MYKNGFGAVSMLSNSYVFAIAPKLIYSKHFLELICGMHALVCGAYN